MKFKDRVYIYTKYFSDVPWCLHIQLLVTFKENTGCPKKLSLFSSIRPWEGFLGVKNNKTCQKWLTVAICLSWMTFMAY